MRVLATCLIAFGLFGGTAALAAGGGTEKDPASSASAPANAAAPASPAEARVQSELQELRELLLAQGKQFQEQNEQLKEQLREQQQKVQSLEAQFSVNRGGPSAALIATAPAAMAIGPAAGLPANAPSGGAEPQKADEAPTAIHIKGITLTPGGYMAAESAWRQRALSADVNTPFNSIPLPGSSQSHVSEFNASGRQSRIAMLAEGKLDRVKIGGYYEADFLSAGTTSNGNESNSYTFRQRQFWAQAAFNSGWTFTGGQMWSLVTETKKGVDNRTEAPPMVIDSQYNVGFSWARQYGFRVARNFNNKVWLAFAVENPQTTFAAHNQSANFLLGTTGNGGGLLNATTNYSFNAAPDLIFKAAFEPGWGHFEVFGLVSTFRDRVFPNAPSAAGAFNNTKAGGGVGANARVSFLNKRLDVGLHFLGGSGIGRYGTVGLPDATVHPNGTLALVRSYQSLGTIEWHAPKFDVYANVGGEYAARTAHPTSETTAVGYGSPLFNNSGCWTETAPGSSGFAPGSLANCAGDTRNVIEGTLGFWYRFYKGPKGTVQWGPQYSYITRNTWSGVGSVANPSGQPSGSESMVLTSFRYVLP
ncbi:MAG: hypothetical protein LAN36_07800 [Acidobacteriia bacterium]|nr:hypothetical protein [Terriglobia bacterium]